MENKDLERYINEGSLSPCAHCHKIESDFFTWFSDISEFRIVFYENRECFHHCYYDFSDASKNPIIEGDYLLGTQLRCADEENPYYDGNFEKVVLIEEKRR